MDYSALTTSLFVLLTILLFVVSFVYVVCVRPHVLKNKKIELNVKRESVSNVRHKTYPPPVPNTWYHVMDSDEVKPGKVYRVIALGQELVVWRTSKGDPVVQNATVRFSSPPPHTHIHTRTHTYTHHHHHTHTVPPFRSESKRRWKDL